MMEQRLPLRTGVGIIVLNKQNKIFVGKRKDNPGDKWQMPQGGVDEGEDYVTAMRRELLEETGIQNIEIIKEIEKIYQYADYVTVNISSPNTPELRNLHDPDELAKIFEGINNTKSRNASKIPVFLKISPDEDDGTIIKIIIGDYKGYKGIIKGIASNPQYFDIYVPPNKIKSFPISTYDNCFAYIFEGAAKFDYSSDPKGIKIEKSINNREYTIRDMSGNKTLITFDKGNEVKLLSGNKGVRFLLVSGNPIQEPVAWHGPIVMNTNEEIEQAITELNNGTFIRQ